MVGGLVEQKAAGLSRQDVQDGEAFELPAAQGIQAATGVDAGIGCLCRGSAARFQVGQRAIVLGGEELLITVAARHGLGEGGKAV
ncbi:MAG: hypothetical protein U5Q44_04945 [Dehalococcoidia bacterium]|nr:hypothetical protein [Dehalococcoidia bacterium]